MACPYADSVGNVTEESQQGDNRVRIGSLDYSRYLQLDKLLDCQALESAKYDKTAHDEHLFIITHQAYELWFKQILHELDSVRGLFAEKYLDERKTLVLIRRLNRIGMILKLLVDQFMIMETMTPLDFMDFRGYLAPASGFQSYQFRLLENKLGIRSENRVKYNQTHYKEAFTDADKLEGVTTSTDEPSLLDLVQRWLERTPGLELQGYNFWEKFRQAAIQWLEDCFKPKDKFDPRLEGESHLAEFDKQMKTFESIFDVDLYNNQLSRGERRLSHKAFQGAMMLCLYRDEPRFHQPYQVINLLMDIDSLLTKWRYNHVIMVQRMIGSKVGTGGSSGYHYLRSTVSDRYKVFLDLFNMSTYLIPHEYIPPLTSNMKRRLSTFDNCGIDRLLSQNLANKVNLSDESSDSNTGNTDDSSASSDEEDKEKISSSDSPSL